VSVADPPLQTAGELTDTDNGVPPPLPIVCCAQVEPPLLVSRIVFAPPTATATLALENAMPPI
jgi:hypothetical protein